MGDLNEPNLGRARNARPIRNPEHSADLRTREDGLRGNLALRLGGCNHDELRVLDLLLGRLELGRDRYGHLDLGKSRQWDREESEELLDARIYQACASIVRRDEQLERLRCEVADEVAARVVPGLRELRDATAVVAPPGILLDWEMADIGGES